MQSREFSLESDWFIINQALPDHHILFKHAEKDYLEGRPKNGMFIAIPGIMKENVTDISPIHWRIQAAIIKTKNSGIMIINSYIPYDSKSPTNIDPELEELIAVIKSLLLNYQFDDVIWMGVGGGGGGVPMQIYVEILNTFGELKHILMIQS